jgi:hypothetical protein
MSTKLVYITLSLSTYWITSFVTIKKFSENGAFEQYISPIIWTSYLDTQYVVSTSRMKQSFGKNGIPFLGIGEE